MRTAYIVQDGEVLAKIDTQLQSSSTVDIGYNRAREALSANREYNLVNSSQATIYRAKEYERQYNSSDAPQMTTAIEINPNEFYLDVYS